MLFFFFNVLCYMGLLLPSPSEMSIRIRGDAQQESFTVTNHRNTTLTAHCQLPRSSQAFPQLWMANCENQSCEFVAVPRSAELSRPEQLAAPPASMTPCFWINVAGKSTGTETYGPSFPGMNAAQMSMALWRYMVIPAE